MSHKHNSKSSLASDFSAEELAELRHLLDTQRSLKRKSREDASTSAQNRTPEHTGNEANIGSDSHNNTTAWIGVMIRAPAGERGHGTNGDGRLGFKTEDILKHTGITAAQWSQYLSTTHRLIDHHFDITKSWTTNSQNKPNAWRLIISQMQDHHPHFLFHEGNWLIRHLAISHLTNMNRKFRKMGADPDLAAYHAYLSNKTAPPSAPQASKTPRPVQTGSERPTTSSRVLNVPNIATNASLQNPPSNLGLIEPSNDSETETDFGLSDLYDDEPPSKKQRLEVPALQSEHQSQRSPLLNLNSPARAPTSKVHPKQGTQRSRLKGKGKGKGKGPLAGSDSDEGAPPPGRPQRQSHHVNNPRNTRVNSPM